MKSNKIITLSAGKSKQRIKKVSPYSITSRRKYIDTPLATGDSKAQYLKRFPKQYRTTGKPDPEFARISKNIDYLSANKTKQTAKSIRKSRIAAVMKNKIKATKYL